MLGHVLAFGQDISLLVHISTHYSLKVLFDMVFTWYRSQRLYNWSSRLIQLHNYARFKIATSHTIAYLLWIWFSTIIVGYLFILVQALVHIRCFKINSSWSWIWDYFHDKGLLFQGQGLIGHKGVFKDKMILLVHINLACVIAVWSFKGLVFISWVILVLEQEKEPLFSLGN